MKGVTAVEVRNLGYIGVDTIPVFISSTIIPMPQPVEVSAVAPTSTTDLHTIVALVRALYMILLNHNMYK